MSSRPHLGAVADRVQRRLVLPDRASRTQRAEAPAVAVLATALRLGPDDRPGTAARAEHPGAGQVGMTQHVGDGVAGTGQVIKGFVWDAVGAVGFADG